MTAKEKHQRRILELTEAQKAWRNDIISLQCEIVERQENLEAAQREFITVCFKLFDERRAYRKLVESDQALQLAERLEEPPRAIPALKELLTEKPQHWPESW